MKKIIETFYYKEADMEALGFNTEQKKAAVGCVSDLMTAIKDSHGPFGMICFFISEQDLLGHRPVTIWSNFTIDEQQTIYEDYIANRLRMKAKETAQTPTPAGDE